MGQWQVPCSPSYLEIKVGKSLETRWVIQLDFFPYKTNKTKTPKNLRNILKAVLRPDL